MKVQIDGKDIFEIDEEHLLMFAHEYMDVQAEIERRLQWVIDHPKDVIFKKFQEEWVEKLRNDPLVKSLPISRLDLIKTVVKRKDYKNRFDREKE